MTIPTDIKTKILKLTTLTPPYEHNLRQDIKQILSKLTDCQPHVEDIEDVGPIDQVVENKTKVFPPYPARKPSNYNCTSDPQCPPGCDVCCKLPYHAVNGKTNIANTDSSIPNSRSFSGTLYVHHFFTKSGLWKVDNRQEKLSK